MIKGFHRFAIICKKVISWIAVATVAAMLVIMCIEVVRRYLFGKTFIWSDEIIRILLVFCAYFGGATGYFDHNLTSFDMVITRLSKRTNDILKLIVNVVMLVFFIILLYLTYKKIISPSVANSVSTSTGLSGAFPYYGIFTGLIFMTIFTIDFFPGLISAVVHGKEEQKEAS